MFFLKSGTLIFVLFGIIITDGRLTFWVRSASTPKIGDKVNPKRGEKDLVFY